MEIEVNGNAVNYESSGDEAASTVMLSHSLASSLVMWDPQVAPLAERHHVIRYDTRGHGRSGAPDGAYSLDLLGDDAVRLMDALELDRVHWVGLSMGGMIGQNLALHHGDRLLSLSLCDTSSQVPGAAAQTWDERIETARDKGMAALSEATIERWFTGPYLEQSPAAVDIIREVLLATPSQGFIGCCHAIRELDYTGRLGEIDKPTLIIVGEDDQGTPVAASEVLHAGITGSKLVILPSAAHLSNVEQADMFTSVLLDFLGQHDT